MARPKKKISNDLRNNIYEVAVSGDFYYDDENGITKTKKYTETFNLKNPEKALSDIQNHLINGRLKERYGNDLNVGPYRTCAIVNTKLKGDVGISKDLESKSLEDMSLSELREYCVLKEIYINFNQFDIFGIRRKIQDELDNREILKQKEEEEKREKESENKHKEELALLNADLPPLE